MKVSFDFDSTLSKPNVQNYAKRLIEDGHEVHIVTSRTDMMDNKDLFRISDELGIKRGHIHFVGLEGKWVTVGREQFDFHLDDDWIELNMIAKNTKTPAISVFGNSSWQNKLNKIVGHENI